jgi:Niemann-Pick C1 protein
MCFWIQLCVFLTLIDVIGFMQCWGLQLDFITCIALQMAVGLCVDYAAHVGHTFLTIDEADKDKRTLKTVLDIGPAVVYGGTSTLLMFAALGTVDAYGCLAFFKVNDRMTMSFLRIILIRAALL